MAIVKKFSAIKKIQKHLLGIQNLSIQEANLILDEAKNFIKLNRSASKKLDLLKAKLKLIFFLNRLQELKVPLNWLEKDWEQML